MSKNDLDKQMVVNTKVELCGASIARINVTYVNYTENVKGEGGKTGR